MAITLPSKPKVVTESDTKGTYQIESLYPGYGHTLGNSLRRIILSSLHGAAITSIKVKGADHEFSTLDGVKEDLIRIILNLKKVRVRLHGDEPAELKISIKGEGTEQLITAGDIEVPANAEILNSDQPIATLTKKGAVLDIVMRVESGIGYVPRELVQVEDPTAITLDAIFTPVRKVSFEVENMRVGDRTDFNRLIISIETDGTINAREALESSVKTMISQLAAVVGIEEKDVMPQPIMRSDEEGAAGEEAEDAPKATEDDAELRKTRIENLGLSTRTEKALEAASIRTVGGLTAKTTKDILALEGLGDKAVDEIKKSLKALGFDLKE